MDNHPATFQAARIRSITPSRGTKTPTTMPTISETVSAVCPQFFGEVRASLFSKRRAFCCWQVSDLENQRQLALHFRFPLPEAHLAAHFH